MISLRRWIALAAAFLLAVLIFGVEVYYVGLEGVSFPTRLVLFIFLNLNLLGLLVLMFFVGKNLVNVYFERKHRVLGYRFKTKFVTILVVLTMIPSTFLFIVSSGVITRYLDRWFDPQIEQPLTLSVEIAKSAYEIQRQQTLAFAKAIASGETVPGHFTVKRLGAPPEDASETVRSGFDGKEDVEVVSGAAGDTIRAVAPEYSGNRQTGVVIVESFIGRELSRRAEGIRESYRNYMTLASWKTPIKTNYLLVLSFFTLMSVFMALWVALRISRGITDPIQMLAQATERVAKGDLDISVGIRRDDEIGLLVSSFNRMVKELREGKESLQRTWTESNRRRIIIESIVENINAGVLFLDASGNILTVNSAASRILDVSPPEILNRNYTDLLSMLKSEELKETVKGIRVSEFRGLVKETKVTAGGRIKLLRIFITTIGEAENWLGTLVVFDDLTDIVRAQKALAWEEVARRIAHEIKNPLTPIKLSTEHMIKKWQNRDEDFGQVFDRSTRTIIREVEGLRRLVNEFARFGTMPEINKTPVFLSSVVDGVVNLYRDYKELVLTVLKPESEPLVELDAEQFKRVIINIMENAIQAMRNKGDITISTRFDIPLNRAYVDIADNGPGIREEDKEKLFLPYFSTKRDGTGLGLAIASRVVAEHRGYIRIKDNEPTGTVFTIELPIREG